MAHGRVGDENAESGFDPDKQGWNLRCGVPLILLVDGQLQGPWSLQQRPRSVLLVRHLDGRVAWSGRVAEMHFASRLVERLNGYESAREFPPERRAP